MMIFLVANLNQEPSPEAGNNVIQLMVMCCENYDV